MPATALRDRNVSIYLALAGVGSTAIPALFAPPGASAWLAGGRFLYAEADTRDFLGVAPETIVCARTAVALAMEAYVRAALCKPTASPIGIGATGAIATTRVVRGGHRAYVARACRGGIRARVVTLGDGTSTQACDRASQEAELAACVQRLAVADAAELWSNEITTPADALRAFDIGQVRYAGRRHVFFPGSFDPVHEGHLGMAAAAEAAVGATPVFMIECAPPHKPAPATPSILDRVAALRARGHATWLTFGVPLYVDKARAILARGQAPRFIIGADTVARMMEPRWYDGTQAGVDAMLLALAETGAHFYVFAREGAPPVADVVPLRYRGLFTEMPGRWAHSSSALRAVPETRG